MVPWRTLNKRFFIVEKGLKCYLLSEQIVVMVPLDRIVVGPLEFMKYSSTLKPGGIDALLSNIGAKPDDRSTKQLKPLDVSLMESDTLALAPSAGQLE